MRAMLSETPGGPESLKLVEMPSKPLGKGQVRVAVKAAGVNFPDTLIIQDKYQFKPPRPFAPGHEIAGDITEVGEGVSGYKVGDRVIGMIGSGGYATEAVVDRAPVTSKTVLAMVIAASLACTRAALIRVTASARSAHVSSAPRARTASTAARACAVSASADRSSTHSRPYRSRISGSCCAEA